MSCNGYPGADWVSNVRAADRVTLSPGPPHRTRPHGRAGAEEARPILRAFPAAVPTGVQLMKRAGVLTDGTPDECAGLAGRLPVFRIDPIT